MKNVIWVRQNAVNIHSYATLHGPFSSYAKAEEFVLKTGSGLIVTESLEDAKLRVEKQVRDEYDRTNTLKLLPNTLEAMAVEPKKVAAKVTAKKK